MKNTSNIIFINVTPEHDTYEYYQDHDDLRIPRDFKPTFFVTILTPLFQLCYIPETSNLIYTFKIIC